MKRRTEITPAPSLQLFATSRARPARALSTTPKLGSRHSSGAVYLEKPYTVLWEGCPSTPISPETSRYRLDACNTPIEFTRSRVGTFGVAMDTIISAVSRAHQKQADASLRQQEREQFKEKLAQNAVLHEQPAPDMVQFTTQRFAIEMKDTRQDLGVETLSTMKAWLFRWKRYLFDQRLGRNRVELRRRALLQKSLTGWARASVAIWRKTKIHNCVYAFQMKSSRVLLWKCLLTWIGSSKNSICVKRINEKSKSSGFLMSMLLLKELKKRVCDLFLCWKNQYESKKGIKIKLRAFFRRQDRDFLKRNLLAWTGTTVYRKLYQSTKNHRLNVAKVLYRRRRHLVSVQAFNAMKTNTINCVNERNAVAVKTRNVGTFFAKTFKNIKRHFFSGWKRVKCNYIELRQNGTKLEHWKLTTRALDTMTRWMLYTKKQH